jgi:hypothetical protein
MKRSWHSVSLLTSLALVLGCPADDPGTQDGDGTVGEGTGTAASMSDTAPMMTTSPASTDPPSDSSDGDPPIGSTSEDDGGSTTAGPEPVIPENPTPCGNNVWECGDTLDNDGDGFYDLFDPECTGPCDDDEGSFQTGIPGDNSDCHQDCFFDGDSGSGNDGCLWDLTCDPQNPGANINCEYNPGNNCNNSPPNQSSDCIEFCTQFVPPGCDCFGCCEVTLDDGTTVGIFLNSGADCSLANLDACQPCTLNESCFDPCVPEDCEICFGQTEPPPGCGEQTCDNEMPCDVNEDCPTDFFCLGGCCYPPPPG